MVDLLAMWFHQRTGPNSGISYGCGTVMFLSFVLIGIVGAIGRALPAIWPLFVLLALGYALYWAAEFRRHKQHEKKPMAECKLCQRDLERLRAKEKYERIRAEEDKRWAAEAAEADRLRRKYKNGS